MFSSVIKLCFLALVLLAMILPQPLDAAKLLQLRQTQAASGENSIDQLDVTLAFADSENEIAVQVRAFVISASGRSSPVASRNPAHTDAEGNYLQQIAVTADGMTGEGSLRVSYADFDLAPGPHSVGLLVSGRYNGEAIFDRPTPAVSILVGEAIRRVGNAPAPARPTLQVRRMTVYIPGEKTRGGTATLERREVEATLSTLAESSISDIAALRQVPWQPWSEVAEVNERSVLFATNRNHKPDGEWDQQFGIQVADGLAYGLCTVNIPIQHHRQGRLETPNWWQQRDPEKYFLLEAIHHLSASGMLQAVGSDDVLVFVHGFNNTFENAVLRTAQIHYDLGFAGKSLAFCWPSAGSLTGYALDSQQAELSAKGFADLIEQLVQTRDANGARQPPQRKVHVLAHSMGNRIVLNALYQLHQRGTFQPGEKYLEQVVLAAPDVGALMFNNLLPYTTEYARRVTYYYCSHDAALGISRDTNNYEPVGLLPFFEFGLDTICADGVGTSFFGHNYFSSAREVLADIQLTVTQGLGPDQRRPPLTEKSELFGHSLWSFTPIEFKQ